MYGEEQALNRDLISEDTGRISRGLYGKVGRPRSVLVFS